jgi:hypothetical protein
MKAVLPVVMAQHNHSPTSAVSFQSGAPELSTTDKRNILPWAGYLTHPPAFSIHKDVSERLLSGKRAIHKQPNTTRFRFLSRVKSYDTLPSIRLAPKIRADERSNQHRDKPSVARSCKRVILVRNTFTG